MIRVLLVVLAILVAVLAFVLDKGWLYAASGAALAAALGWLAYRGWLTYAKTAGAGAKKDARREERLEDVGIVSVRPQERKSGGAPESGGKASSKGDGSGGRSGRPRPQPSPASDAPRSDAPRSDASRSGEPREVGDAPRASSSRASSSSATASSATGGSASSDASSSGSKAASSNEREEASASASPEDRTSKGSAATGSAAKGGASQDGTQKSGASRVEEDSSAASSSAASSAASAGETASARSSKAGSQTGSSTTSASSVAANGVTTTARDEEPVLAPFVESLRAAVGAHTACLLVQEDVVLEYRIRAIASRSAGVQRNGVFSTGDPLLTASMSRQPISVRRIDGGRDVVAGYLRYYDDPPEIDHIALAPIPLRDDPSTTFLLVDATEDGDLGAPQSRTLIEHFAQTLAVMLQERTSVPSDSNETLPGDGGTTTTETPRVRESDPVEAHEVEAHEPTETAQGPRPRREIIAEEIDRADDTGGDLALVLVHLNRAEAIERGGAAAVASAEHALRRRLEEAAPDQRVERFGELTYGVFYRAGIDEVETWAADLHDAMKAATGELEGGASIGAALLADRHQSPDDLRDDATRALREAYETGACTIVE